MTTIATTTTTTTQLPIPTLREISTIFPPPPPPPPPVVQANVRQSFTNEGFTDPAIDVEKLYNKTRDDQIGKLYGDASMKYNIAIDGHTNIIKELTKIEEQIAAIEKELNMSKINAITASPIRGIQSIYNGMALCAESVPDASGEDIKMIKANKGCIAVTGNNNYFVSPCDPTNKSQHFRLQAITMPTGDTPASYSRNIDFGAVSDNDKNILYPFLLARSVHNNNCIASKTGGISVEPCMNSVQQRWQAADTK
jgi:hypothetical protein